MAVVNGYLGGVFGFGVVYGNKCLAFVADDGKVDGAFKIATDLDSKFKKMSPEDLKAYEGTSKFKPGKKQD